MHYKTQVYFQKNGECVLKTQHPLCRSLHTSTKRILYEYEEKKPYKYVLGFREQLHSRKTWPCTTNMTISKSTIRDYLNTHNLYCTMAINVRTLVAKLI